jgi:hypothetical protein
MRGKAKLFTKGARDFIGGGVWSEESAVDEVLK